MATTPPSPLAAWNATIFSAPFGLGQRIEHLFQYWYQLAAGDSPEWRRFVLVCEDLISLDQADDARITFDVVNYTGGAIDTSWTTSDYDTVAGKLESIAAGWAAHMAPNHRFSRIDAYKMTFKQDWVGSAPSEKIYPFNLSGPPLYTKAIGHTGTQTGMAILPQAAMTVTEVVPVRRSWGRFYLPFCAAPCFDGATGRFTSSLCSTILTLVSTAYSELGDLEFQVVVPITYSQKERVAALEQVIDLHVDDVPDVIRRRRFRHSSVVARHAA